MVDFESKILTGAQEGDNSLNQKWWEQNPMTYDWEGELGEPELTLKYFASIDNILGQGHALINNPRWPNGYALENFIPYHEFKNKKVLEIGCGAGLVSSHIAKSGAHFSCVDITDKAVAITKKRFALNNLRGDIRQMDAQNLEFEDNTFDYVVSWGVIHHSGNMQQILNHIHRVLKPGGKAYLMVYNKNCLRTQIFCRFWLGVVRLKLLKQSLDDIMGSITDGHIARHLTQDEFKKMAQSFSSATFSYSDEADTTSGYLLGPFHRIFYLLPFLKRPFERWLARRWGWYMEIVLTK